MIRLNKFLLILGLLLVSSLIMATVSVAFAGSESSANSSAYFANKTTDQAESVFDFPADHLLHRPEAIVTDPLVFLEWLYWTGILEDPSTGQLFGFEYTIFQQNLKPGLIGFVNHVAISDVYNSQHPRYKYAAMKNQSEIINGTDDKKGNYWRYQDAKTILTYWKDQDAWNILAKDNVSDDGGHGQNISLNLTLANDKFGYYLHNPKGVGQMGICEKIDPVSMAGITYYYSHPAMNTTGTITIDGREFPVRGDSWFDHQWGGFGNCLPAWDWFSLRLDDGDYMMLFNHKDLLGNNLPNQRGLTYIDHTGNATIWEGNGAFNLTATRWWRSDLFGFMYPLDWILNTPVGEFALEPYFDEQTMNVAKGEVKYWEGIMRIRGENLTGRQIGKGYMELTGYSPISSQMS